MNIPGGDVCKTARKISEWVSGGALGQEASQKPLPKHLRYVLEGEPGPSWGQGSPGLLARCQKALLGVSSPAPGRRCGRCTPPASPSSAAWSWCRHTCRCHPASTYSISPATMTHTYSYINNYTTQCNYTITFAITTSVTRCQRRSSKTCTGPDLIIDYLTDAIIWAGTHFTCCSRCELLAKRTGSSHRCIRHPGNLKLVFSTPGLKWLFSAAFRSCALFSYLNIYGSFWKQWAHLIKR